MLQRSVERRAAGVVAQQDRAAVAQSHNRQVASRLQVAVAMAVLLTGGKGSVGDARMVHDFARSGPSTLSLSLSLGFGIFRADLRDVSVRDEILESGEVWFAGGSPGWSWQAGCVFCWPVQGYRCSLPTCLCPPYA